MPGRVDADGAAVDPERYDYRRAARDAIHFPALVDRFWQNTRRCVGWDVQYFGTVEPQKRGAPHFHAAIRGAIPRAELRAITAATYHQVWWPAHDQLLYSGERLPVWDTRAKAFTDPDTGAPLPTWDQACEDLPNPPTSSASATSPRQRHPRRHRRSRSPRRLPHKIFGQIASAKPLASTNTPPTPTATTPTGSTPNSDHPMLTTVSRCGCSTASNPTAPDTP